MVNRENIKPLLVVRTLSGSALSGLKMKLAILTAAANVASEGVNRATAAEVASKVPSGFEVNASMVGQVLSELGLTTTVTHGKKRYVLSHENLEASRQSLETECNQLEARLAASAAGFKELSDHVQSMEASIKVRFQLKRKELELTQQLKESPDLTPRIINLQLRLTRLQEQASQAVKLENECNVLNDKIQQLPAIEQWKASLQEGISKYQSEERELTRKEAELSHIIAELKPRKGWVELAAINEAILKSRQELDQLSNQIGEKRSLLDKLLMRKKAGAGR